MSSGIYSALTGARTRMEMMDIISDNLANVKTAGFKRGQGSFQSLLDEAKVGPRATGINYARLQDGFTDQSQGVLTPSGVPTHLAIEGEGFFKLRDQAGTIFFSRQGNFTRDGQNNLVTNSGLQVLGEGDAPLNLSGASFSVEQDGTINLESGETSRIPVYGFADTAVLQRHGGGMFVLGDGSGQATQLERPTLMQGQLEESNVQMVVEMGKMMEAMRAFEANQKMMKTFDSLAAKASELGSL